MDYIWLREVRSGGVVIGVVGLTVGILLYYYPWQIETNNWIGIALVVLSSVGYTIHLTAIRHFARSNYGNTRNLVMKPMFIGAVLMSGVGLAIGYVQLFPQLSQRKNPTTNYRIKRIRCDHDG